MRLRCWTLQESAHRTFVDMTRSCSSKDEIDFVKMSESLSSPDNCSCRAVGEPSKLTWTTSWLAHDYFGNCCFSYRKRVWSNGTVREEAEMSRLRASPIFSGFDGHFLLFQRRFQLEWHTRECLWFDMMLKFIQDLLIDKNPAGLTSILQFSHLRTETSGVREDSTIINVANQLEHCGNAVTDAAH